MKDKDRQEILSQLQGAFFTEEKQETRMTTEVLRFDNHNIARMTSIRELPIEEQIYAKYPDAVVVKEMITILGSNQETPVKEASKRLNKMLVDTGGDESAVEKLISLCRNFEMKYYSTADGIKKQMVLYCFIAEADKL